MDAELQSVLCVLLTRKLKRTNVKTKLSTNNKYSPNFSQKDLDLIIFISLTPRYLIGFIISFMEVYVKFKQDSPKFISNCP